MRITLSEPTEDRIRDVLGADVDLTPEEVPAVLARLAVEAPETYSQVLEELSGSQIRLDSEAELRRRRRRAGLRRLLFWWGEYESSAGDRLLDKRRVAAAVPLALAAVTMAVLVYALVRGHPGAPGPRPAAGSAVPAKRPLGARLPEALLAPPRPAPPAIDRPLPPPPARSAAMVPLPSLEPLSPALTRAAAGPIVLNVPPHQRADPARGEAEKQVAPVVYNRGDRPAPQGNTPEAEADAAPGSAGRLPADTSAARPFAPGTRIDAALVTGALVVAGGGPVPVIAESTTPPGMWLGQATLGPGDRIQMTFTLSSLRRDDHARGVGLDPDRLLPGLAGRTSVRHASAAAAMTAAALQAAADYTQAESRQGTLGFLNGFSGVFLGGQTPEAWTFLAARLAQEFQTRSTAGGFVTTTEVGAGTRVVILITGAS